MEQDSDRVSGAPRVVIREEDSRIIEAAVGRHYTVGREGDIPLSVSPEDRGVSRVALQIWVEADGWRLKVHNREGVRLQPWMESPRQVNPGQEQFLDQPRIRIDVIGRSPRRHQVLLERDDLTEPHRAPPLMRGVGSAGTTIPADPCRKLTEKQLTALVVVYEHFIYWPPLPNPKTVKHVAAAVKINRITESRAEDAISESAVKQRLKEIQKRVPIHLVGNLKLDDPRWVYTLVERGGLRFADTTTLITHGTHDRSEGRAPEPSSGAGSPEHLIGRTCCQAVCCRRSELDYLMLPIGSPTGDPVTGTPSGSHTMNMVRPLRAALGSVVMLTALAGPANAHAAPGSDCHIWAKAPVTTNFRYLSGTGYRECEGWGSIRKITVRVRQDRFFWPDRTLASETIMDSSAVLTALHKCNGRASQAVFTEIIVHEGRFLGFFEKTKKARSPRVMAWFCG